MTLPEQARSVDNQRLSEEIRNYEFLFKKYLPVPYWVSTILVLYYFNFFKHTYDCYLLITIWLAGVADKTVYTPTCAANRLGCEVGDLSGKYGEKIDFPAGLTSAKYFYTDEIPLSGAYSVVRKSITVHQEEAAAARYACSDIIQKVCRPFTSELSSWHQRFCKIVATYFIFGYSQLSLPLQN